MGADESGRRDYAAPPLSWRFLPWAQLYWSFLGGRRRFAHVSFISLLGALGKEVSCGFLSEAKASKLDTTRLAGRPMGHFTVCSESEPCPRADAWLGRVRLHKAFPVRPRALEIHTHNPKQSCVYLATAG